MTKLSEKKIDKNRQKLLNAIAGEVKQLRSQSLHRAVQIHLTREKPQARLIRSWDIQVKIGKRPSFKLQNKASMLQIFDRAKGKLLILGHPGAAKTTTLLELARCLTIRCRKNPNEAIPILLNFSSWKKENRELSKWLIEAIQQKYSIPADIGNYWLEKQQLLLLLDGFDELESDSFEELCQAIAKLLANFSIEHLVVCSSFAAYKNCQHKLSMNAAAILQPLNKNQIKDYAIASRSRELWFDIKEEPELLKLAEIPWFLSVMTLAYEEILIESWRRIASVEERQKYLLNAYIRRQLGREIKDSYYSKNKQPLPDKTKHWLAWLATRMTEAGEREFSADKIQENWLKTKEEKQMYRLGVRLLSELSLASIFGITFGSIFGLIWGGIATVVGGIIGSMVALPGIKKLMLRMALYSQGNIPWNYRRFLNYSAERLFLQKVGDRYQFIHKILQQHFANMK